MAQYVVGAAAVAAHVAFLYYNSPAVLGDHITPKDIAAIPAWTPIALSVAYIVAIRVGMTIMSSRRAFDVSGFMTIYNLYETLLSAWMMTTIWNGAVGAFVRDTGAYPASAADWHRVLVTQATDATPRGASLAFALWVNYQSKFLEFADTTWMVLRKKNEQVSTLHVIHHVIMGPIMWAVVTLSPGGPSAFGPMMNSGVHTVMYFYYFLTGVGVPLPRWIKQNVTTIQIVQFVVGMYHALYHLLHPDAHWPFTLAVTETLLLILMLYMFGGFFVASYVRKGSKAPRADADADSGKAKRQD